MSDQRGQPPMSDQREQPPMCGHQSQSHIHHQQSQPLMPHQQNQQGTWLLQRLEDGQQVVLSPHLLVVLQAIVRFTYNTVSDFITNPDYFRAPHHTCALSGADWVQELLSGHPERIRNELGVYRSTFTVLLKAIQTLGLQSSRYVSIEEQLAIFLYTVVTGLSCRHVGERFQRSSDTVTK